MGIVEHDLEETPGHLPDNIHVSNDPTLDDDHSAQGEFKVDRQFP